MNIVTNFDDCLTAHFENSLRFIFVSHKKKKPLITYLNSSYYKVSFLKIIIILNYHLI